MAWLLVIEHIYSCWRESRNMPQNSQSEYRLPLVPYQSIRTGNGHQDVMSYPKFQEILLTRTVGAQNACSFVTTAAALASALSALQGREPWPPRPLQMMSTCADPFSLLD